MNACVINSKIEARAFALAAAIELRCAAIGGNNNRYTITGSTVEVAKDFEKYIIGNADLPEVREDHTKGWVDVMKDIYKKQAEEDKKKRDKDWEELMKSLPKPKIADNSKDN